MALSHMDTRNSTLSFATSETKNSIIEGEHSRMNT